MSQPPTLLGSMESFGNGSQPNLKDDEPKRPGSGTDKDGLQPHQSQLPQRRRPPEYTQIDKTPIANQHRMNNSLFPPQPTSDVLELAHDISSANEILKRNLAEIQTRKYQRLRGQEPLAQTKAEKRKEKHERFGRCQKIFAQYFISPRYREIIIQNRKATHLKLSYQKSFSDYFWECSDFDRKQAEMSSKDLVQYFEKEIGVWLSGEDGSDGDDLEKDANNKLRPLEEACSQIMRYKQRVNCKFLYNNLPDAIREIRVNANHSNAELSLMQARSPTAENKEQILDNARREAMGALEAAATLPYIPLSAKCKYWLGRTAHDRSGNARDNVGADKLEAAKAFLSAFPCIGHYQEGEDFKHFIEPYTAEMQEVARSENKLPEEKIQGFPQQFDAAMREYVPFFYGWGDHPYFSLIVSGADSGSLAKVGSRIQATGSESSSSSSNSTPKQSDFQSQHTSIRPSKAEQQDQQYEREGLVEHETALKETQGGLTTAQKRAIKKGSILNLRINTDISQASLVSSQKRLKNIQKTALTSRQNIALSQDNTKSLSRDNTERENCTSVFELEKQARNVHQSTTTAESEKSVGAPSKQGSGKEQDKKHFQLEPGGIITVPETTEKDGTAYSSHHEGIYKTRPPGDIDFRRNSLPQRPSQRQLSAFSGIPSLPEATSPLTQEIKQEEGEQMGHKTSSAPLIESTGGQATAETQDGTGLAIPPFLVQSWTESAPSKGSDDHVSSTPVSSEKVRSRKDSGPGSDSIETLVEHSPPERRDSRDDRISSLEAS